MTTKVKPFEAQRLVPIYGVPGAGKTTKLIELMQECLTEGIPAKEIAFASFTRTASYEGRDRAAAALSIPKNQFRYFRTIHSLCLNTATPKPHILDTDDYKLLAAQCGDLSIRGDYSFRPLVDDGTMSFGMGTGDYVLSLISLARSHMIDVEELVEDPHTLSDMEMREVAPTTVLQFNKDLEEHKKITGKVDFSDMLQLGCEAHPLPVKVAFVDEAQDLTNLQWLAVDNLFREAETVYVGGDDDQAIYDFSGGNSEVFRAMGEEPETIKLEFSHRCPKKVFEAAEEALHHIDDRVPKRVIPQDKDGVINIVNTLNDINEDLKRGEWLFLVRQHSHAIEIEQHLRDQYFYFRGSRGGASISDAQWAMIRLHEKIRRGEEVYATELGNYYKHLKIGHCVEKGYKTTIAERLASDRVTQLTVDELVEDYGLRPEVRDTPWYEALAEIPSRQREYIRGVLERGERAQKPRIKVATIHAAKGTQAENVVICARMGKLSMQSIDRGKLDEYRAAYVAMTRAQERLILWQTMQEDDWAFYATAFKKVIFGG